MIDLETLGVSPGCQIASVSAVAFDDDFNEVDRIYMNLESVSGFFSDSDTLKWWDSQDFEARSILNRNKIPAINALSNLSLFMMMLDPDEVWCNGASFDFPILAYYFRHFGMEIPWKFWNERDLRTLKNIFPVDIPFEGTKHYGIDDCIHQIKTLKSIWNKIN